MEKYFHFFLIIILLLLPDNLYSQNGGTSFFAPDNRLAFGNSLFKEQDYLRAIDEYRSYLITDYNDTLVFKIAYAYQTMGYYNQAEDYFKSLFFNSHFYNESRSEYYLTNFLKLDNPAFRTLVNEKRFMTNENQDYVNSLNNVTYFFDDVKLPDSSDFVAPFEQKFKNDMAEFYYKKMNPGNKSVTKGIVLSSILPGAGKIYAGEITDGITAFLVTGIFSFLAYDNFRADHDFRAWLFTGLAAYFYAGNIYGTAAAVQQYNAGIKLNFENDVKFFLKKNNYLMSEYDFLN